jgi:uncharacterized protein YyaL (SSP411 family)
MTSITCPHCGNVNSTTHAFCGKCGLKLPKWHLPRKKSWLIGGIGLFVWVVICALSASTGLRDQGGDQTRATSTPNKSADSSSPSLAATPSDALSPKEHLARAKELATANASSFPSFHEHINAIPPSAKEYAEAQKLRAQIVKREAEMSAQNAKRELEERERTGIASREAFANEAERHFLDQGMDFYITVGGASKTTITFKYVLMSRPLVYKIQQEESFIQRLRQEGFRKLILTDGYDDTWTINL